MPEAEQRRYAALGEVLGAAVLAVENHLASAHPEVDERTLPDADLD